MRTPIALLITVAFNLSPAMFAGDFLNSGGSARSVGAGGVYLSGRDSVVDAMAINPAGLALLGQPTLDLNVAAIFARGSFTNRANPSGKLDANGAVPYGAFGTPLRNSRFSIGFAALPELISAARWRYTDTFGGVGNVSYGTLDQKSEIIAMRAAAGVGMFVNSRLQLGATLGAVYNSNTLQGAYVFQSHPVLTGLKTLLDLKTSGVGWKGTVGVLVTASTRIQCGGTYNSRTLIASRGVATGNAGIQFAAIGLGTAQPDFRYDARVDTTLPQSVMAHIAWSAGKHTRVVAQTEWIGWNQAFARLPVTLTHGNNSDLNGLLGSDSIRDSVPLNWHDQFVARAGVEHSVREGAVIRVGFARASDPVPSSTLSPLTAAITRSTLSAGFGYRVGRCRFDLAYMNDPSVSQRTGQSALKSGEYSNSKVSVETQGIVLSTSIRL